MAAENLIKSNPQTNIHAIADLFLQFNRQKEMTGLLVSYMRSNRPEDGVWQTRVLEFNLLTQPNVAETIFQTTDWNQFDRIKIADLCEKKGLF